MTTRFKIKKNRNKNLKFTPFPVDKINSTFRSQGIFTGISVEIYDKESIEHLEKCKSFGVNPNSRHFLKKRKLPECISDEITFLTLTLEEAFFLNHAMMYLEIRNIKNEIIPGEQLWERFSTINPKFIQNYVGYLYLKAKNWVIRSGIKFGGDYLVYKDGPEFYHASYVIVIQREEQELLNSIDFQGLNRIAATTGKELVFLEVSFPKNLNDLELLHHLDKFRVKELCMTRYLLKKENSKKKN